MVGWAARWACFFGLYLVLAGQVSAAEAVAGGMTATLVVLLDVAARRHAHRRMAAAAFGQEGWPWLRLLLRPALALLRDMPRVGTGLLRCIVGGHPEGIFTHQPFRAGGEAPGAAGRRAAAVLALSVAPNAYVAGIEPDALVLHQFVPEPPKPDRDWPL